MDKVNNKDPFKTPRERNSTFGTDSSENGSNRGRVREPDGMEMDTYDYFVDGEFVTSTHYLSDELFTDSMVEAEAASRNTSDDDEPSTGSTADEDDDDAYEDEDDGEPLNLNPNSTPQLLSVPTPAPAAKWSWILGNADAPAPPPPQFDDSDCGWTQQFNASMKEINYFMLCFPSEVIQEVLQETNSYAQHQLRRLDNDEKSRRQRAFKAISENELIKYLCIRLIMGIDCKPETTHYWSRNPILGSVAVPQIMSSDRFHEIQRYLHFVDNENNNTSDKIYKIRALWNKVMAIFQSLLVPYEELCVDESLTKFKGQFKPKQYIPSKRSRFGIKTFTVADSKTGFLLNSIIYEGKTASPTKQKLKKDFGYGGSVVLELCEPYFHRNRTIFCDNYFTSPALAEKLLQSGTLICGTLRSKRLHSPPVPKLRKGEAVAFSTVKNGCNLLVEYWRDKRLVRMISAGRRHFMKSIQSRRGVSQKKPSTVDEYNQKARSVDYGDKMIQYYETGRKTLKWSTKMFFRMLDMCIFNAFTMMKSQKSDLSLLDFRLNLINQLLASVQVVLISSKGTRVTQASNCNNATTSGIPSRLVAGNHFPFNIKKLRNCVVCSKKDKIKRSTYTCKLCEVTLCIDVCFEKYHTKLRY